MDWTLVPGKHGERSLGPFPFKIFFFWNVWLSVGLQHQTPQKIGMHMNVWGAVPFSETSASIYIVMPYFRHLCYFAPKIGLFACLKGLSVNRDTLIVRASCIRAFFLKKFFFCRKKCRYGWKLIVECLVLREVESLLLQVYDFGFMFQVYPQSVIRITPIFGLMTDWVSVKMSLLQTRFFWKKKHSRNRWIKGWRHFVNRQWKTNERRMNENADNIDKKNL